jgi:hypothetical protein
MNRRPRKPLNAELEELEQELAALTIRVAALRQRSIASPTTAQRTPTVGDRVRFTASGVAYRGVIVGVTRQRVRIRQDGTCNTILRAPHNVTIL